MKRHEWIRLVLCGFVAGVVWNLKSAKWAGLGFVELGAELLPVGALTLVGTVLAAAVGGFLYGKAMESSPQRLPAS